MIIVVDPTIRALMLFLFNYLLSLGVTCSRVAFLLSISLADLRFWRPLEQNYCAWLIMGSLMPCIPLLRAVLSPSTWLQIINKSLNLNNGASPLFKYSGFIISRFFFFHILGNVCNVKRL